jgi:hypothetical protein
MSYSFNRPTSGRNEETSINLNPLDPTNYKKIKIKYNGYNGFINKNNNNNTFDIIYNNNGNNIKKTVNQTEVEIIKGGRKSYMKKRRNTYKKRRNTYKKRRNI